MEVISEFSGQGAHRTGTPVDVASAEWLMGRVSSLGHTASLEDFPLNRVDVSDARLVLADSVLQGVPLFDGSFTTSDGVTGTLGRDIPIVETAPAGASPALDEARRSGAPAVIAVVGRGDQVAPRNADAFTTPWGPPVLQAAPEALPILRAGAEAGASATVIAAVERNTVDAFNVVAGVAGTRQGLKPLVVMTPRSGWGPCASERGGGLVCWLAALQSLAEAPPARTVHFVATSAHELGHLGLEDYVERRLELPAEAHLWLHLGANLGAASPRHLSVRASHGASSSHAADCLQDALSLGFKITVDPPGPVVGEAANIANHGGRYLSFVAANECFHLPGDQWPGTVDVDDVAAIVSTVVTLVREYASAG